MLKESLTFSTIRTPSSYPASREWPYLDPKTAIRLTRGLPALRSDWIKEREDTGIFTLRSSSLGSIK
jgi:hypothetical protein